MVPTTLKQRRFAAKWLKNGKGIDAARAAGYSGTRNSLYVTASRLLRSAKIQAEIERLMRKEITEDVMDSTEVLRRLSKMGRASLADVLTDDGEFKLATAKENHTDDLLKKLKVRHLKDGTVEHEYELHDPQSALVHLGKYHKLFTDRVESTDTTQADASKSAITAQIEAIASRDQISPHEAQAQLQAALSEKNRPGYVAALDPTLHPELWPQIDAEDRPPA